MTNGTRLNLDIKHIRTIAKTVAEKYGCPLTRIDFNDDEIVCAVIRGDGLLLEFILLYDWFNAYLTDEQVVDLALERN